MTNESSSSKHTKVEWKIQESDKYVSIVGQDDFHILDCLKDSAGIHKANAHRIVTAVNLLTEIEKLFSPNELTPLETYNKIALLLKNSTK